MIVLYKFYHLKLYFCISSHKLYDYKRFTLTRDKTHLWFLSVSCTAIYLTAVGVVAAKNDFF